MQTWSKNSWRSLPAVQLPEYPDTEALAASEGRLASAPGLVSESEITRLREELAAVAEGKAFLLQGGDCAESFAEFSEENLRAMVRVFLQMAVTLTFSGRMPVVKVGRVAGQFAKPRSSNMETVEGESLPSYRGDIVNGSAFHEGERVPDPDRMQQSYHQSAATLNLLRSLSRDGFSSLSQVREWNSENLKQTKLGERYGEMAERIDESLAFIEACGLPVDEMSDLGGTSLYTSHEALLLPYEEALTRVSAAGAFNLSAHLLWVGERTRQLDHAHIEFVRGLENPIGVKVGPTMEVQELKDLVNLINPDRIPGKLVLISRMGADKVREVLPDLLAATAEFGSAVIWCCDPMHGNTVGTKQGFKTRDFDRVLDEVKGYFEVHEAAGSFPGGVHLEMTGQDVTECTGGIYNLHEDDLYRRYHTHCDPRLNASQALELAFLVGEMLKPWKDGRKKG